MATVRSDSRRKASHESSRRRSSSRNGRSSGSRRPLQGRDTGYRVGGGRRQTSSRTINPRLIIVGVVGLLLLIALIFGISSCVRSCSSRAGKQAENQEVQVNPSDKRVAFGVSGEQTDKISAVLDRNEAFERIAKHADKISDERLIELAINEPEAIEFVAGSLEADGSTTPYDGTVTQGEFVKLFTFDPRWGYAPYADGTIGSTGSGPVTLAMASMALSGKTTYDPVTIANAVTAANLASGTTGMDDSFLSGHAADAGLVATSVEASSDGIYGSIAEGLPVAIKLKSDSGVGSSNAHWALITQLNSDNSITLYDPTSAIASSHSWSLGAVSSRTDTAYALTGAPADAADATTGGDADAGGAGATDGAAGADVQATGGQTGADAADAAAGGDGGADVAQ